MLKSLSFYESLELLSRVELRQSVLGVPRVLAAVLKANSAETCRTHLAFFEFAAYGNTFTACEEAAFTGSGACQFLQAPNEFRVDSVEAARGALNIMSGLHQLIDQELSFLQLVLFVSE